jgi:hypothetical protein
LIEERLKKVGRFARVVTEGYSYDLPEEARAELGFAVLDTAVVIAEVPQAEASLDALWCAAKHLPAHAGHVPPELSRSRRHGMSNTALRAKSAISCFSQVRSAAFDPAGLKLAEGLLALAQAIEGLAAEHDDILSRLRQIGA